jgi:hypothetical protein
MDDDRRQAVARQKEDFHNIAIAPKFTLEEKQCIADWFSTVKSHGWKTELSVAHELLGEALHIIPPSGSTALWIVHKTDGDGVAVRMWPGIAEIVSSISIALKMVENNPVPET